jgi:ligand-binding sensor domain-containing protein
VHSTSIFVSRPRHRLLPALLVVLLTAAASPSFAFERQQRRFGLDQGLPFSEVSGLAEDARGFIWIATLGGLYRYDGVEMRPWPEGSFRPLMLTVATGPQGEVVGLDYEHRLVEVRDRELRSLPGPEGASFHASDWPARSRSARDRRRTAPSS